jgi:DNA-binding CsgD family transcriptional regulator
MNMSTLFDARSGAAPVLDRLHTPETAPGVTFDLADPVLGAKLAALWAVHPRSMAAETYPVLVTDRAITDRAVTDTARHVLRIDAPEAGVNTLATRDANLILAAVSLVASGNTLSPTPRPTHVRLSAREREVAALLIDGASNKHIARALDISVHTAKFHVAALLQKLSARNRADAVAVLLKDRLI